MRNKSSPSFLSQLCCCFSSAALLYKKSVFAVVCLCCACCCCCCCRLFYDNFSLHPREESQARVDGVCSLAWLATRILGELTHMNRCYCLRIHVADKCVQPTTRVVGQHPYQLTTLSDNGMESALGRNSPRKEDRTWCFILFTLNDSQRFIPIRKKGKKTFVCT